MLPVYLKLKNFLSHKESVIDFTQLDYVTLIVGINRGDPKKSNGVGKSALFDALTFALFEKCRISGSKSTGLDNLVRNGQKKAEVDFRFKLGNDLYRVVRSRDLKKRKSDVSFQIQNGKRWEPVSIDKKSETNAKIIETIGINYDVFVRSVLLEQHDADGFAKLTPGGRKEVVSQILQLDHYDRYVKHAKEKLEQINVELLKSDSFIADNSTAGIEREKAEKEKDQTEEKIEVHTKQIEALNKLVEKIREELNKEQRKVLQHEDLIRRKKELGQRIHRVTKDMQQWISKVESAQQTIKDLEQQAQEKYDKLVELKNGRGDPAKIKRALEKYREMKIKVDELHSEASGNLHAIRSTIKEIKQEIDRIENLDEGECPTCYEKVTEQSKGKAHNKLQERLSQLVETSGKYKARLDDLTTKKEQIQQRLKRAEEERDKYNRTSQEAKSLKGQLDNVRQQLTANKDIVLDAKQRKQMNKEDLDAVQDQMAEVLEKLESQGDIDLDRYQSLQGEIGEKVSEVEYVQKKLNALQIERGKLEERIEAKTEIVKKIETIQRDRARLDHERRIMRELIQAFGKTGIQALILENSAVEIEKIANDLLNKITDGKVSIEIVTQRENKDGTFSECFDINITDEFHSSPFNMYSGGERFRIAFAIRIALNTLLARRSGVKVPAIFYDEAFTDLDADGVEKLMEIFTILARDFRYQLVVTHQTELKSQFNDVICVTKTKEGSTIT